MILQSVALWFAQLINSVAWLNGTVSALSLHRSTVQLLRLCRVVLVPLVFARLFTQHHLVRMLLAANLFVPCTHSVVPSLGIKLASQRHFQFVEQVAHLPAPHLQWRRTSLAQP
ncbi:MAG: hypothetical protein DWH77_00070 [Planctomycetota bacterium]|nr:MAG: hypothetical protein DWH77_00070 [Planctomycetota bacterium]